MHPAPTADRAAPSPQDVSLALAGPGFAFVPGAVMRAMLALQGPLDDWDALTDSWNRLELDEYMADHGRYRRRRHAVYAASPGAGIVLAPPQPHFQSLEYNALNGGIARWFAPVEPAFASGASLRHADPALPQSLPGWTGARPCPWAASR